MNFDLSSDEFDTPEIEVSKKKKEKKEKSAEEEAEEYKYKVRCRIVSLSQSRNIHMFIDYVKQNEKYITENFTKAEKECLRRGACERVLNKPKGCSIYDGAYLDRVFGPYIDIKNTKTEVPIQGHVIEMYETRYRGLQEEITAYANGSYHNFWMWINDPRTVQMLKQYPEYKPTLYNAIETAKLNNTVFEFKHSSYEKVYGCERPKEYEPEDDIYYNNLLNSIQEVKI